MSGDIYFGIDKSLPRGINDGYVNSSTFMAFGDLLEGALSTNYSRQLEEIKISEAMALYNFCPLSAADYNNVIYAIRIHISKLTNPTDWQKKGMWVWREMAEPFIRKDERYDFAFHHESPPTIF